MNNHFNPSLNQILESNHVEPKSIYRIIQLGIQAEQLSLEANEILNNRPRCRELQIAILEGKHFLSLIRMSRLESIGQVRD